MKQLLIRGSLYTNASFSGLSIKMSTTCDRFSAHTAMNKASKRLSQNLCSSHGVLQAFPIEQTAF